MQPACIRVRGPREPWLPPARDQGSPGPGRPLPQVVQRVLQPFFPDLDLSKIIVHQGIPEELKRRAASPNPAAISVGNHIYVEPGYASLLTPSGWRVLIHELRHIEQYQREGPEVMRKYKEAHRKYGYWDNPYERDAYRFESIVSEKLGL